MPTSKLRVTKSLLDSWIWSFKRDDGWEDFLSTLNREKKQPTEAMLNGVKFENILNATLNGEDPTGHEWEAPVREMASELWGARQQVTLFAETQIQNQTFLLHGVLDYLREGHIWDCKFTKNYHLNKYFWEGTSQTSMYLALVPEAQDFTYIVSDGKWVYRERYPRDIVPPVENYVKNFMRFLKQHGLWEVYAEKWSVQ
jgi:hypothetical protein